MPSVINYNIIKKVKNKITFILIVLAMVALLQSCLVNSESDLSIGIAKPNSFSKPKTPLVAAYVHIGNRKLDTRSLNLEGVDVVNLAFTVIKNNRMGLLTPNDANNFMIAKELKRKYPNIKVLVSVGGAGTSKVFSSLTSSPDSRAIFVDDAVRFIRGYGMDGIDIDWEFPGMDKETRASDRVNFTALIQELRYALDKASIDDGKRYYLTVASGAFEYYLTYIEPVKIANLVDYFHIMTYDFFGQWNETTGHHANLFGSAQRPKGYSVKRITESYIKAGVPRSKIVIGAAFYGREWTNVASTDNGLYQKGKGVGSVNYKKIKTIINQNGYKNIWDSHACAPYLYNPTTKTFISYENRKSVYLKVNYAYTNSLAGIMYWEHFSDYNGELSGTIINQALTLRNEIRLFRLPGGFQIYGQNK